MTAASLPFRGTGLVFPPVSPLLASLWYRSCLSTCLSALRLLLDFVLALPARAGVYAPGLAYCASQLRSVLAALSLLSAGLLFTMGCLFLIVMAHSFAVAGLVFPPVSPLFFVLRGTGLVLPPVSSRVSASPAVVYAPGLAYCTSQLRSVLAALVLPFADSLSLWGSLPRPPSAFSIPVSSLLLPLLAPREGGRGHVSYTGIAGSSKETCEPVADRGSLALDF